LPPPGLLPNHLLFSGIWQAPTGVLTSPQAEAHAERAFLQLLGTLAAAPFDTQASLGAFLGNAQRRNIIAFIIHFKNQLPICEFCRKDVANRIANHFSGLLHNGSRIRYDDLYKGAHLVYPVAPPVPPPPPGMIRRGGGIIPWGTVIPPRPIPLPSVVHHSQFVRIIFIVGNGFKNVDIFE
jgi:hypothetical protein